MQSKKRSLITMVLVMGVLAIGSLLIVSEISNQDLASEDAAAGSECVDGVWCGGCVNRCVTWGELGTGGCNGFIDRQCNTQPDCAGDGVSAGGRPCCSGLVLCPNGRCGTSCVGPASDPIIDTDTGVTCRPGNIRNDNVSACGAAGCRATERSVLRCTQNGNSYEQACVAFANCVPSEPTPAPTPPPTENTGGNVEQPSQPNRPSQPGTSQQDQEGDDDQPEVEDSSTTDDEAETDEEADLDTLPQTNFITDDSQLMAIAMFSIALGVIGYLVSPKEIYKFINAGIQKNKAARSKGKISKSRETFERKLKNAE